MTGSAGGAANFLLILLAMRIVDAKMLVKQKLPESEALNPNALSLGETSSVGEVPEGKNIAIILRGETFRYVWVDEDKVKHRPSCAEEGTDIQMNCTRSVIENVIKPLERRGNTVDVFFTTAIPLITRIPFKPKHNETRYVAGPGNGFNIGTNQSDCPLDGRVIESLRDDSSRVVKNITLKSLGQGETLMKVMDNFNQAYGGFAAASARFDYIMILRHDMYWFKPIDQIHANFEQVNVLARCDNFADCIHDSLWMMPGSLYGAFSSCVGRDHCFNPKDHLVASGHHCQMCLRWEVGKAGHEGAFGWLEPAPRKARVTHNWLADPQSVSTHVADLTDYDPTDNSV